MQSNILKIQSGNHAYQYPACNHLNHFSVLWLWASHEEMSRTVWVSLGDISIVLCHVRDTSSPFQGPHGQIGPKTFRTGWLSLKLSRQMPQTDCWSPLPASHTGTPSPELEISALVSSAIEYRVSLYHSDRPISQMQHSTSLWTIWWRIRELPTELGFWAWSHQQISDGTSWNGSSLVPACGGIDDDQELIWDVCLDFLVLNVFVPCRQRHGVQYFWLAPSWSQTPEETCSLSWHGKGHNLLLMWSPSIDTHVAPGFDCWSHEHSIGLLRWNFVTLQ